MALPRSAPQLTSETAQDLLDTALGEGATEVEEIWPTGDGEMFGRIVLFGNYGDADLHVGFRLRAARWMPVSIKAARRSFPFALVIEQPEQAAQLLTLAYMDTLAIALGTFRADAGGYPQTMHELVGPAGNMGTALSLDGWGHPFRYVRNNTASYTLTSLGSDGRRGPAPPDPWLVPLYDPDIVMSNGEFVQAPGEGPRGSREESHGQAR